MRPELLTPAGDIMPETLRDMLALVGENVSAKRIEKWAPLEMAVVYDWAVREHLHASDNNVRRRQRPSLLADAAASDLAREILGTFRGAHHGDSQRSDVGRRMYAKWVERWEQTR
jgi:hypothetical protein